MGDTSIPRHPSTPNDAATEEEEEEEQRGNDAIGVLPVSVAGKECVRPAEEVRERALSMEPPFPSSSFSFRSEGAAWFHRLVEAASEPFTPSKDGREGGDNGHLFSPAPLPCGTSFSFWVSLERRRRGGGGGTSWMSSRQSSAALNGEEGSVVSTIGDGGEGPPPPPLSTSIVFATGT